MNRLALLFVVLALTFAAPAFAQRAAGPNSGVLGTIDEANARHTLIFRGSVFGVWDDIISENFSEVSGSDVDDRFLRGGMAGGAEGGLAHARRTDRMRWLSSANTEVRAYGTDDDAIAATVAGRTALDADVNSRVTVGLGGGWLYSPFYDLSPSYGSQSQSVGSFGGGFGVATAAERNMATDGDGRVSVRLSRRDTLEASGSARYWKFLDQDEGTVTNYGARGRYRHSLTEALGVFAGFGRDEARYRIADAANLRTDTIDVGIDYGDTLEFSRRAALSFSFSTSATRWEDETHWRVNGTAALTRAFGRTGSGLLRYQRAVEPAAGFREPLLSDTFSGAFSNQIGRDASWSVNAGYIRGETGFGDDARRYDVYDAGGRITRALTRNLAVFGDYTYYRYEVPAGSTVFEFLPKFSRQSLRFGVTLWAPIINDTRPPRDTR